jgi:hypothetical protein
MFYRYSTASKISSEQNYFSGVIVSERIFEEGGEESPGSGLIS